MFENIGVGEIVIIGLILILLLGTKRLNEIAKSAGHATKELKEVKKELEKTIQEQKEKFMEGGETKIVK